MEPKENTDMQTVRVAGRKPNWKIPLIFLILVVGALTASANEPDYRSYFTYPDSQIAIDWGDGHSKATPFKNHSVPKAASEIPSFLDGAGEDRSGRSAEVHWRFVQKTDSGDLYLISIYRNSKLLKEVPILYIGSTIVGYDRDGIKVTIEPVRGTG